MKAMIFAAGIGSRLRPLTDTTPKALVRVGGVPMLERVILRLKAAGFTDITVNIHHLGEHILQFLDANQNFGITIHVSDERGQLLDTGGGILKAKPFLDGSEPFLVHNVDIATDADLATLYRHHTESNAVATLLVADRTTSRKLAFRDGRLCGWTNTQTGEVRPEGFTIGSDCHLLAFQGIHVVSPQVFSFMGSGTPWQGVFPIIPFYLSICTKATILGLTQPCTSWFDIGKLETLARADAWYTDNEKRQRL